VLYCPHPPGRAVGATDALVACAGARDERDDLHRLNENDYHNGVQLHLTTPTGRTGSI
jgi:hypothetical protein